MPRAGGGTVVPVASISTLVTSPSTPTSSYTYDSTFLSSPSSEDQIATQGKYSYTSPSYNLRYYLHEIIRALKNLNTIIL